MQPVLLCSDVATLAFVLDQARVTVIHRDLYAIASYFPDEVRKLLAVQRPDAKPVVVNHEAARDLRLPIEHGELGFFAGRMFVGKIDPDDPKAERYMRICDLRKAAIHRIRVDRAVLELVDRAAALAPGASSRPDGNPFAILGLPEQATLAEAEAARKRLVVELHPDRVHAAKLGARLEQLAEEELKRINGAVDAIRRLRCAEGR
jgi:hypothetical protein